MSDLMPMVVYAMCLAASVACAGLLARAWLRSRTKLLLWTAVSFGFLALNNLALVLDLVIFPSVDLWVWRQAAAFAAIAVLVYGFIWEVER